MEKFRYRKQKETLQNGVEMQNHFGEAFLQKDYTPHNIHNMQHAESDYDQRQLEHQIGHDQRLQQHDQQFIHDQRLQQHDQQFGHDHQRLQHDQQIVHDQRLQHDQQFGHDHQRLQHDQQFGHDHQRLQHDHQIGHDQRLQHDQQFGHDHQRSQHDQQSGPNIKHLDKQKGQNQRLQSDQNVGQNQRQHDQHFGYNQRKHDQQFDQNQRHNDQEFGQYKRQSAKQFDKNHIHNNQQFDQNHIHNNQQFGQNQRHNNQQFGQNQRHNDQQFGQNQRQHDHQFGHDQRHQHNQQFSNDHKQLQPERNHRRTPQQQYVPDLRPQDHQDAEGQRATKQHTDWNGVMQDLFGMELPQTAESTHESASSGIASDVTSVYPATPSMTTFKGGDSADSTSSAKSTVSRDSGTKSVSISGSPGPDQTFKTPLPRGTRTTPAIPKNGPPILVKNTQHMTSPCPQNGHRQVNGFSLPPAGFTTEKNHPKERRHKHPEPSCIQCSNSLNCMPYKHHIENPSHFNDCHAVDPSFCCELDQCFVDSRGEGHFIDSFGEDRFIEYPSQDIPASRDRLHIISPPMCPTISPGFCCGQAAHQNNHDLYLVPDKAPQNLQPWHKRNQIQHNHQLQQHPPQIRYSPLDSDNNRKNNFDTCNNHNHHNLPQSPKSCISSPILQTFKPKSPVNPSLTPCHYQASKTAPHEAIEKHPQTVLPWSSQPPRDTQMLITQAQIHTPSPQPRGRKDNKMRSAYAQPEPQVNNFVNKPQFGREADLSRYLVTGINHLSLCQTDYVKGKTSLMPTSCKRLSSKIAPFEYLPNDVLLKIFCHLSTDHLCRCAQVCRLWYNAVWDNPILWTTIVINNENIDVDRALKYLTRRLSYNTPKVCMILEKININTCCRLSDRGLQTVAKRCPELRYLDMQSCHLITNLGVKEAVSRCVNLERLDVTGCPLVTCLSLMDSLISHSASRHLQRIYLRYLDMTDCPNVTDEDLCITTSQCTQLLFLYLRRCPLITDLGVTYIANNCCSLRELSLSDCKSVTDLGMRELAKLRENLRYLSVAKCEKVSDQGVMHIARNCSKLRYLNVRGCEAFSDTGLDFLARNCPRLRSLDIGKCDITDDGLYALSMHCPNLRKLGMKSCDAITDKGIVLIAYRCSSLQQLHVQDCCLSPDAYAMVRRYCKRAIIEHTNPAIL